MLHHAGAYQASEAGWEAYNCAVGNIKGEIRTWCPMLVLPSTYMLHGLGINRLQVTPIFNE